MTKPFDKSLRTFADRVKMVIKYVHDYHRQNCAILGLGPDTFGVVVVDEATGNKDVVLVDLFC